MRYILFGDSIGVGVGDYQNGGWATQLRLLIDRQRQSKDHTLINLSISGETSRGLVARLEQEARLRMRQHNPREFTFLIAIGTNDARINKANSFDNTSLTEFEQNIEKLISITKKLSVELILIGILPVDETFTLPYKEEKYYQLENLREYNQIIKNVANRFKIQFIGMYDEWVQRKDLTALFADGLHPNINGHKMIFEKIQAELFSKKS